MTDESRTVGDEVREALEQAAQICDAEVRGWRDDTPDTRAACARAARAIRALASVKEEPENTAPCVQCGMPMNGDHKPECVWADVTYERGRRDHG